MNKDVKQLVHQIIDEALESDWIEVTLNVTDAEEINIKRHYYNTECDYYDYEVTISLYTADAEERLGEALEVIQEE